jgi:hypothetical protein
VLYVRVDPDICPQRLPSSTTSSTLTMVSSFASLRFLLTETATTGVTITETFHAETISPKEFEHRLKFSMDCWKNDERRGIWLRLPISSSHLIPIAVSQGFWFHHCGSEYLLLCNWIPGGKEASRLPPASSHYIGVAGFILNSRRELLMVQEKHGPAAGIGLWKLPGGLCDVGEEIHAGHRLSVSRAYTPQLPSEKSRRRQVSTLRFIVWWPS